MIQYKNIEVKQEKNTENLTATIVDISGKVLISQTVNLQFGANNFSLDTEGLL